MLFVHTLLKTFLFWQYEETYALFWQTQNLNECLIYLLRKFYKCIQTGALRHFFIPRFNILEIKLSSNAKQNRKDLYIFYIVHRCQMRG